MKGGWMLVAGLLMVGGCSADGSDRDATTGEEEPVQESPARPPAADAGEGNYVLASVGGATLPGTVSEADGCRIEVIDGSLRLQSGRFAFQNQTREVCGTTVPEPVMHAAGGTYVIENGRIVLSTDVGGAFGEASGTIDDTMIMLTEMSTDAGTESVTWHLERDNSQSVTLPGSRDSDDAADMSTTPGVTSGG